MTETDDLQKEPNILRCTLKKSWSVFVKWICGSIIAMGLFGAFFFAYVLSLHYGEWILENIILNPTDAIGKVIVWVVTVTPWPLWVILITASAIVSYSYFWCVSREFTDDDWQSIWANESAIASVIVGLFAFGSSGIAIILASNICVVVGLCVIAFAVAAVTMASISATDPVNKITVWYYIFRFVGAYRHYRKRVKA